MTNTEDVSIRRLPDRQTDRTFEGYYRSPLFVLITTTKCPQDVFECLVSLIDSDGLGWLTALNTFTSRKILLGRLSQSNKSLPDIVFKKSRFGLSPPEPLSFQPRSPATEIKSNLLLGTVLQRLAQTGGLPPPKGFDFLSVNTETALGILVDKQNKSRYSIFIFEGDFDFGEILQYTDPPINGGINYNPRDWKVFCGIKATLDRIKQEALKEGLYMQDYDVDQVLYRVDKNIRSLELILIDSERFRIEKKDS